MTLYCTTSSLSKWYKKYWFEEAQEPRCSSSLLLKCFLLRSLTSFPKLIHHQLLPVLPSPFKSGLLFKGTNAIPSQVLSTLCHPQSHLSCHLSSRRHLPWVTIPYEGTKVPGPMEWIFSTVKNFIKILDVFKRSLRFLIPIWGSYVIRPSGLHSVACSGQAVPDLGLRKQAGSGSGSISPFLLCPPLLNALMPPHPPHPSRTVFWHLTALSLVIFIFSVEVSHHVSCMILITPCVQYLWQQLCVLWLLGLVLSH